MKGAYLLDTTHLGAAINPVSSLRERLHQAHRRGARLGTCVPVLCELEAGIQDSPHQPAYRRQLVHVLRQVRIWPLKRAVAQVYGELFLTLLRRGRALSQVDILIAALALEMKLTILTSDKDFAALPEISTENWLI